MTFQTSRILTNYLEKGLRDTVAKIFLNFMTFKILFIDLTNLRGPCKVREVEVYESWEQLEEIRPPVLFQGSQNHAVYTKKYFWD